LISFFRYCLRHFSKNTQLSRVEDNMLSPPRRTVTRTTALPNGTETHEEIDMLTEFSWRNFFFTINFAKVMQKLSKHRSHRIRMLVQYKSTVPLCCCIIFASFTFPLRFNRLSSNVCSKYNTRCCSSISLN
jgi:hypothetical protein